MIELASPVTEPDQPETSESKPGAADENAKRQRLDESMVTLRNMNECPEYLMLTETPIRSADGTIVETVYSVWIPDVEGGQEKLEAKTYDELLKKVQARTAENLTELMKRKNVHANERGKTRRD